MEKKDLLLDVDEVICFSGFLEAVNDFLGTSYVIDDFTEYYIDEVAVPKDQMDDFNKFINERNLYKNAHILPNAIKTIKLLTEYYEIYLASSCINPFNIAGSGRLFADKYEFLINNLPFLNPNNFIFTSAKHRLKAGYQIDDRLDKLDNDIKTRILFPSYHNKDITDEKLKDKEIIRAGYDWREGWDEVGRILIYDSQDIKKETKKYYSLKNQ